ncbi:hypothetical protein NKG94_12155 [Micromonospora sp. M12]
MRVAAVRRRVVDVEGHRPDLRTVPVDQVVELSRVAGGGDQLVTVGQDGLGEARPSPREQPVMSQTRGTWSPSCRWMGAAAQGGCPGRRSGRRAA